MLIGVPTDTLENEGRVAATPSGVEDLVHEGHEVLVQAGAGLASDIPDEEYRRAGASLVSGAAEAWATELVVKVKEPQPAEFSFLRSDQVVFTYFHFAAYKEMFEACLKAKVTALAYETITLPSGEKPLLTPMSEVAGRMSVQVGAAYLQSPNGGRGILLAGIPGVAPGRVAILGAGVVGVNAARIAAGLGARVSLMDINLSRLRALEPQFPSHVELLYSNTHTVKKEISRADLVIGAVLVPGAKAPRVISEEMVRSMKKGAVIVDVAIDQGGCVETSRPTHHSAPVFTKHGVIHYCVTNMPGAVARTSTYGLTNATLPYVKSLSRLGWKEACRKDPVLALGLNLTEGKVVHPAVAEAYKVKCLTMDEIL